MSPLINARQIVSFAADEPCWTRQVSENEDSQFSLAAPTGAVPTLPTPLAQETPVPKASAAGRLWPNRLGILADKDGSF